MIDDLAGLVMLDARRDRLDKAIADAVTQSTVPCFGMFGALIGSPLR